MSRQIQCKQYRKYTNETLSHAVTMIRSKSISLRQAAKTFGIPKTTLSNNVNNKSEIGARSGPGTVLSKAEEDMIADWAITMAKMGFGRTRAEILDTVQSIIKQDGRDSPFVDCRPGKDWYYAFLKRHPELASRAPQQLAKERAVITPKRVELWFSDFSEFMSDEVKDSLIWKDPSRWFNADESGFPLCPKSGKVLAPRGVPNIYNFTSSDKTQITVLACMNAAGLYLRPLIVFAGQRFTYNPLEDFPEAIFGRTNTGWMDSDLFATWLKDVFSPALDENCIKRPVVLFVDGHSTHCTLTASKFCRENGIVLYCLLEHGSHLMQPCDVALFSALKGSWKQAVRDFQISNVGEFVTRGKFAQVFKSAWESACTVDISVKGFRDSGLFPLNPSKVLGTLKMEPSKVFCNPAAAISSSSCTNTVSIIPSSSSLSTVAEPESAFAPISSGVDALAANRQDVSTASLNETTKSGFTCTSPVSDIAATRSPTSPVLDTCILDSSATSISLTSTVPETSVASLPVVLTGSSPVTQTKTLESLNLRSEATVSPVVHDILKLPVAKSSSRRPNKKRLVLPKAISCKTFHDLLEKRQKEKEEETERKEMRKREREENRKQREEEKQKKAKEKEEKKLLREQKLKEKEEKKRIKKIERMEKLKRRRESDSSESDISVEFDDDDMADIDTSIKQVCYACETQYDNKTEDWITCHSCGRWLHRTCVKTIDLLSMSEEEIADLEFECDYC